MLLSSTSDTTEGLTNCTRAKKIHLILYMQQLIPIETTVYSCIFQAKEIM